MTDDRREAPDYVFQYRGRHIAVHAVPLDIPGGFGFLIAINGFLHVPSHTPPSASRSEAVDAARDYARLLIDGM